MGGGGVCVCDHIETYIHIVQILDAKTVACDIYIYICIYIYIYIYIL